MRRVNFILLSLLIGTLNGCSVIGTRESDSALPKPACVAPQPGTFIAAAEWYPDRRKPLGFWTGQPKLDGDLTITKSSVSFVPCFEITGTNDSGITVYPLEEIEFAYCVGNWLFIRGFPNEQEFRQVQGYLIHGSPQIAAAALAELLKHLQNRTPPLIPPSSTMGKVILVSKGLPEIYLAVVDREQIGKEVGKGTAEGAAQGALAGLETGLIIVPPVAAVLILGGAVVGSAAGGVSGEMQAQRNAQLIVMDDAILNQAVQGLDIRDRLLGEIEQHMRIEKDWNVVVDSSTNATHGYAYQDDALRGIVGAVELAPLRIELRTNKSDREKSGEEAEYALSVTQQLWVYSTLNGEAVKSINVIAGSGRYTLSEWREDAGKRFTRAVSNAVKDMPDSIVTNLPNALNKLIRFE